MNISFAEPVDIRTIELRMAYDPEVVESIDGEAGALFDGFSLFTDFENTSPGYWHGYCVILGANDWTTGPGELFRWTVAGVDTGTTIISTTTLNLLPPGGGDYPDAELPSDQIRVDVPMVEFIRTTMPMVTIRLSASAISVSISVAPAWRRGPPAQQ